MIVQGKIFKDTLKGETTTLQGLAEEISNQDWVKNAVPGTNDIIVTTKEGYIFQVYYDEYTGDRDIWAGGREDNFSVPVVRVSYNKEAGTIEVVTSCEDGIETIQLMYNGQVRENTEGKGAKEVTHTYKNITQSGTYQIKVTSSKGKIKYGYVSVKDTGSQSGLIAPKIDIISGVKGKDDWYKGEVKVRIEGQETGGGALVKYRIVREENSEEISAGGLTKDITISDLGLTRIVAWVENISGDRKSSYSYQNIKIDNVAPLLPTITIIEGKEGNAVTGQTDIWYTSDVKLKVTAEDENSGIDSYEYTITETKTNKIIVDKEKIQGSSKEITIQTDGIYQVKVQATDKAGNKSGEVVKRIYKDSTKPNEFTPTITGVTATSFTIIAYTDDNLSGIDKYKYYVDGSLVYEGTERKYDMKAAANTAYGVKVEAYDKAGNVQEGTVGTYTEAEDKKPPIVMVAKGDVTTNSISVQVTATDGESGMPAEPKYTYYIKKASEENYKKVATEITEDTYIFTRLEQGVLYDVKVETKDEAGNVGAGILRGVTLETVPTGDSITFEETPWSNYHKSLRIATTQSTYQIQYKVVRDGEQEASISWTTIEAKGQGTTIQNLDHKDKVYARLWDGINAGTNKELEIKDEIAPQVTIKTKTEENSNSITFTATDGETGIVAYKVTKETTEPTEGWTSVERTNTLGETTVDNLEYNSDYYVWVKDKAGNTSRASFQTIGEFTVIYNYIENGGTSATVSTKQTVAGQAVDLTPVATKEGWTFVGWNTNKDAQEKLTTLTMPEYNITLYAIYSKTITATYKTYGGGETAANDTIYNKQTSTSMTLPSIANVAENGVTYTGRGWSEQEVANANVKAAGTEVTLSGNTIYYASYGTQVEATFYYNSNRTSGSLTASTAKASGTRVMNYIGNKVEGNISVPTAVTGSIGKYNSAYRGIANVVNTMATATPTTAKSTYYAVYSTQVNIYAPTSTTVAGNNVRYRNEYFTSNSAMATKLGTSKTATTDSPIESKVNGYSFYGITTVVSSYERVYSSIGSFATTNYTSGYAILSKVERSTVWYAFWKSNDDGTATKSETISGNLRLTVKSENGVKQFWELISYPSSVKNSVSWKTTAVYGYKEVSSCKWSPDGMKPGEKYYAVYKRNITVYGQTQSGGYMQWPECWLVRRSYRERGIRWFFLSIRWQLEWDGLMD